MVPEHCKDRVDRTGGSIEKTVLAVVCSAMPKPDSQHFRPVVRCYGSCLHPGAADDSRHRKHQSRARNLELIFSDQAPALPQTPRSGIPCDEECRAGKANSCPEGLPC